MLRAKTTEVVSSSMTSSGGTWPTKSAAVFCIASGIGIPALWMTLLAMGRVTDLSERSVAYAFHWTAEGLTAGLLIAAGVAMFRHAAVARRLFFYAAGMLGVAALGMVVYYARAGDLPFVATGSVVAILLVRFMCGSRPHLTDGTYAVLGAVVYVLLVASGNALFLGDVLSAIHLLIALVTAASFSVVRFSRVDA